MKASVETHFAALGAVLGDLTRSHNSALRMVEATDPVTTDILTDQLKRIEFAAWLVRAHLDDEAIGGAS